MNGIELRNIYGQSDCKICDSRVFLCSQLWSTNNVFLYSSTTSTAVPQYFGIICCQFNSKSPLAKNMYNRQMKQFLGIQPFKHKRELEQNGGPIRVTDPQLLRRRIINRHQRYGRRIFSYKFSDSKWFHVRPLKENCKLFYL